MRENVPLTSVSDKLRYLRKQKRMSQAQVAAQIGIPARNYASYECSKNIPSSREVRERIAEFYGVDVAWLYGKEIAAQRLCAYCNQSMSIDVHPHRVYCCEECAATAVKKRQESRRKHTECVVCGAKLSGARHTYCSDHCMKQAQVASKQSIQKRCKNCGELLDSNHKWYCSPECAEEYRRRSVPAEAFREQWDPKSGETYTEYKLRVFPRYRGIYIRPRKGAGK